MRRICETGRFDMNGESGESTEDDATGVARVESEMMLTERSRELVPQKKTLEIIAACFYGSDAFLVVPQIAQKQPRDQKGNR